MNRILNNKIRNIKDINRELFYKNQCNARLNGLFMSWAMEDNETIRLLIHNQRRAAIPILHALAKYHKYQSPEHFLSELNHLNTKYQGDIGFKLIEKEGQVVGLLDNNGEPSKWLNLDNYDKTYSTDFSDIQVFPHRHKRFREESVIDAINDTIASFDNKIYDRPFTQNEELNDLLNNLYYSEKLDESNYLQALKMVNQDIVETYTGQKDTLDPGHVDAILMLEDLSSEVFQKIDYPRQYGFYKTPLCHEMLKFSYLTTFIKKYPFEEEDMNKYLTKIHQSGHWLKAHRLITMETSRDALQLTGINGGMIELSTPRPIPKDNYMFKKYQQRDFERITYQNIYLNDNFLEKIKPMQNIDNLVNFFGTIREPSGQGTNNSAALQGFSLMLQTFLNTPDNSDKDQALQFATLYNLGSNINKLPEHINNFNEAHSTQSAEARFIQNLPEITPKIDNIISEMHKLKRKGWVDRKVTKPESDAEHSYSVALLALILTPPSMDRNKTLRMALVHDIPEVYTGDFTPHDNISATEKARLELTAVQKISKELNNHEMLDLFMEYEKGESHEAKFVKDLDRMDAVLLGQYYDNHKRAPQLLIPEFLPYAIKKYFGGYDNDLVKDIYTKLKNNDNKHLNGISNIISSLSNHDK